MDHLLEKQQLIRTLLEDFISLPSEDYPHLQELLIVDEAQQHFVLFTLGWHQQTYSHTTTFHIELTKEGTIHIHENNTDVPIEVHLVEQGIHEEEIKIARSIESLSLTV